jgi:hypothetical protein
MIARSKVEFLSGNYPSFFQVNNITKISAIVIIKIAFVLMSGIIDFSIDKDNNLPIITWPPFP